jgi:DNA-directed RNA polymerase specialized sigma24 family protein
MSTTALDPDARHPLLDEPERLERIVDNMYAQIHKILHWPNPKLRRGAAGALGLSGRGNTERTLYGGVGADDILAKAYQDLLEYPPSNLEESWEALSVTIAQRKAIAALRKSKKGLRSTDHRPELHVISGDQPTAHNQDAESASSIFDLVADDRVDLEAAFIEVADALQLRDLALELLDDRDCQIFLLVHFQQQTRSDLGDQLGLTGARVGQIYRQSWDRLKADPRYPYQNAPTKLKGGTG